MNERYSMKDVGPILSSNLCTEIALRSDETNSFVCNLGSVNLSKPEHLVTKDATGKWMWNEKLSETVRRGVRFLDSVIDIGFVPHEKGGQMQKSDRPIGLGVMGWTEALYLLGIDYESAAHVEYANEVFKQISIAATYESALLAQEKGSFPLFDRSTWAQGQLVHDSLTNDRVVKEFNLDLNFNHCPFVTEGQLRLMVKAGMRNSTLMAIAPTATISNIVGTEACTELPLEVIFQKKNLSGVFKAVAKTACNNPYNLPVKTAYGVDHKWTVRAAAARQIWIDQSQSTNFYVDSNRPDFGDVVDDLYRCAWEEGLKTTYYLWGQDPTTEKTQSTPLDHLENLPEPEVVGAVCTMRPGDPGFSDCEACQ